MEVEEEGKLRNKKLSTYEARFIINCYAVEGDKAFDNFILIARTT